MLVMTAVILSIAIELTTTAMATTAADTHHTRIMKEMLLATETGKTVETFAKEGKW